MQRRNNRKGQVLLGVAAVAALANSHGMITSPIPRYGVGFDNNDHQRQPIHLRGNVFPASYSGSRAPMVPCGGLYKSQSKVSVTPVRSGESLTVSWEMGFWTGAALHQGTVVLSIAPATANDVGPWTQLAEISFVGCASVSCSPKSAVVQIPSGYKDGDMLTMSFNWTASVTVGIIFFYD